MKFKMLAAAFCLLCACTASSSSSERASNNESSASEEDAAGNQSTADASSPDLGTTGHEDAAETPVECGEQQVVTFETEDEVTLVADYLPASEAGAGAVVLFHQIPPHFDRTSYPQRVLDAISATGVNVLNVDRRGVEDSTTGDAVDAYEGPGGRLDMEASVRFLLSDERACAIDSSRLVLVGASNGTTSVMDYTVGRSEGLPATTAIIWLSPGQYTQNQNNIADHRETLDSLPILWIHPDDEPFSLDFVANAPSTWRFVQLENGTHGTGNFDEGVLEEQQLSEIVSWIAANSAQ